MAGTIGLYFAGLSAKEARELRASLADIARRHGYVASRGPTAGDGNPARLLIAIAQGEVALIRLSDEQREAASQALRRLAEEAEDFILRSAFRDIADALLEVKEAKERREQ